MSIKSETLMVAAWFLTLFAVLLIPLLLVREQLDRAPPYPAIGCEIVGASTIGPRPRHLSICR